MVWNHGEGTQCGVGTQRERAVGKFVGEATSGTREQKEGECGRNMGKDHTVQREHRERDMEHKQRACGECREEAWGGCMEKGYMVLQGAQGRDAQRRGSMGNSEGKVECGLRRAHRRGRRSAGKGTWGGGTWSPNPNWSLRLKPKQSLLPELARCFMSPADTA